MTETQSVEQAILSPADLPIPALVGYDRGMNARDPTSAQSTADDPSRYPVISDPVDISELVGKWASDAAFDEVIASQRQIDWEK